MTQTQQLEFSCLVDFPSSQSHHQSPHALSASVTVPDSCKEICSGQKEAFPKDWGQDPAGERLAERLLRVWGEREGAHNHIHAALQQSQLQRFVGLVDQQQGSLNKSSRFDLLCLSGFHNNIILLHIQQTEQCVTVSYRCRGSQSNDGWVRDLPIAVRHRQDREVAEHREGQHQEEQEHPASRDPKGCCPKGTAQPKVDQSPNRTSKQHLWAEKQAFNNDVMITVWCCYFYV